MKKNIKISISVIFLFFLSSCAVGPDYEKPNQEVPTSFKEADSNQNLPLAKNWWESFLDEGLNTLVEDALVGNLDLKMSLANIVEARAMFHKERAELFPEIDAKGDAKRIRFSQTLFESPFLGPAIQDMYSIRFDASWEIDIFGKLRRAKQAAFADYLSSKEVARDVYLMLVSEITSKYIILGSLKEKIQLTNDKIASYETILLRISDRNDSGLDSLIEKQKADAGLQDTMATLYPLQKKQRQTLYEIAVLIGKPPELIQRQYETTAMLPNSYEKVTAGIPSDLLRRRPDIREAEELLKAATARIGVQVADLFPQFSITGNIGWESNKSNLLFRSPSQAFGIGPSFKWSIFDFGRIKANIRAFTAKQKESLYHYEKTVLQAFKDVESSLVSVAKEEIKTESLNMSLRAKERIASLQEDLYESGLISQTEYLFSYIEELESNISYIDSKENLYLSLIGFYKSLGGEWDDQSSD